MGRSQTRDLIIYSFSLKCRMKDLLFSVRIFFLSLFSSLSLDNYYHTYWQIFSFCLYDGVLVGNASTTPFHSNFFQVGTQPSSWFLQEPMSLNTQMLKSWHSALIEDRITSAWARGMFCYIWQSSCILSLINKAVITVCILVTFSVGYTISWYSLPDVAMS